MPHSVVSISAINRDGARAPEARTELTGFTPDCEIPDAADSQLHQLAVALRDCKSPPPGHALAVSMGACRCTACRAGLPPIDALNDVADIHAVSREYCRFAA